MTPLLTTHKLAEHLALPREFSAPMNIFTDDDGNCYAVFASGFDRFEFECKFPGMFDGCEKMSAKDHEDAFFLGKIH